VIRPRVAVEHGNCNLDSSRRRGSGVDAGPGQGGAIRGEEHERLGSRLAPGPDGPVAQSNAATAEVTGDDASATATQDGARSTNVAIRVASPGDSGPVTQGSITAEGTSAAAGAVESFDIENHDGDTNARFNVAGNGLPDPTVGADGLVSVWRWTWRWQQDEAATVDQSGAGWSWEWGTGAPPNGEASVVTLPLAPGLDVGSFTWSWEWERAGDWSWNWNLATRLECSCIWIWDWVWEWQGTAASTQSDGAGPAAGTPPVGADVEQRNVVASVAEAAVAADSAQAVDTGEQPGTSFAGQIVDTTQVATADALAIQGGSRNWLRGPGVQTSVVVADAFAGGAAATDQSISQYGAGDAGTSQWAGQQIVVDQVVAAQATSGQQGAVNAGTSGHSLAVAEAAAIAAASGSQEIVQDGISLGGAQEQWAGQRTDVIQTVGAFAATGQHAAHGRAAAIASAIGTAEAQIAQSAVQLAVGADGVRSQRSAQLVGVGQVSIASALTGDGIVLRPTGDASSLAVAQNAGLIEQRSAQHLEGSGGIDVQEATQNAFLGQLAVTASTSAGGRGGTATVVNCATVGQGSAQGIGMAAGVALSNHAAFCARPVQTTPGGDAVATTAVASTAVALDQVAIAAQPTVAESDTEVGPEHGRGPRGGDGRSTRSKKTKPTGGTSFTPPVAATHDAAAPVPAAEPEARGVDSEISAATASAPPSGRGGKAAGRDQTEPPLGWPQGLLNGAGSASPLVPGGSGMAAAMSAFQLVLMGGSRVFVGSVVRRPTPFALRPETPG
jgi:hypothetical protein